MTFGFPKSPFFAHFKAILIFETKKVIIWFHFETFIELFITSFDIYYHDKFATTVFVDTFSHL